MNITSQCSYNIRLRVDSYRTNLNGFRPVVEVRTNEWHPRWVLAGAHPVISLFFVYHLTCMLDVMQLQTLDICKPYIVSYPQYQVFGQSTSNQTKRFTQEWKVYTPCEWIQWIYNGNTPRFRSRTYSYYGIHTICKSSNTRHTKHMQTPEWIGTNSPGQETLLASVFMCYRIWLQSDWFPSDKSDLMYKAGWPCNEL